MRLLETTLPPQWNQIKRLRPALNEALGRLNPSAEQTQALAMVASELCENAIKYGCYRDLPTDRRELRLTLDHLGQPDQEGGQLLLCVRNPTDDSRLADLQRLQSTCDWIGDFKDPAEAYLSLVTKTAARPKSQEESRLGIARAAYEGGATLSVSLDEPGFVNVQARFPLS